MDTMTIATHPSNLEKLIGIACNHVVADNLTPPPSPSTMLNLIGKGGSTQVLENNSQHIFKGPMNIEKHIDP